MNKISNEEMTDKALNLLKSILGNGKGLRADDVAEMIGIATAYFCKEAEVHSQGQISKDTMLGMIYTNAAKGIKYNINY